MTDPIFEAGVEYRTRDGRRARVYATDGQGTYPIHGAYQTRKGGWWSASWDALGQNVCGTDLDLMPPEPEKVRFLLWGSKAEGPDNGYVLEVEIQPDDTLKAVR